MNVKPLKRKVLVAQNAHETKSEAGIILDGAVLGNTATARVLAIGPDVTEVAVGDDVYLNWSKSSVVKVDGAERAMIDVDEIIAVIEK
jgi:co-chaperonin GroES (HSP10)